MTVLLPYSTTRKGYTNYGDMPVLSCKSELQEQIAV
jgi:hypothetical protein